MTISKLADHIAKGSRRKKFYLQEVYAGKGKGHYQVRVPIKVVAVFVSSFGGDRVKIKYKSDYFNVPCHRIVSSSSLIRLG